MTNIDSIGIITARAGFSVPDNVNSYFGTGNDLSIKHDQAGGNHSYIFNHGSGVLKIGSDTQFILGKTSNANYMVLIQMVMLNYILIIIKNLKQQTRALK